MKKSVKDVDVKNKLVFLRVDFNVPLDENQNITDDTRIKRSLETINYLIDEGAKIVVASHLGRPKGEIKPELSLKPVSKRLSELLSKEVRFIGKTIGNEVEEVKKNLKSGEVFLLENLRFDPQETKDGEDFAKELAKNIDIYVNDAFGACHRAHSSIHKITDFVKVKVSGFLLEKEIKFLSMATENPPANYTVILGGAKVSDKIPIIENLLDRAKNILIGGAMAYTFMQAKGIDVGGSRVEKDSIDLCENIIKDAEKKGVEIHLPTDHIAAIKIEPNITVRIISQDMTIPSEMMGLDIGPQTVEEYKHVIKNSELIVWNGPMGVFEIDTFSSGTIEIARAVAESKAISIIGGGDSVAAINKAGVSDKITHISTGGGASLEFLSGKVLPGIDVLEDK